MKTILTIYCAFMLTAAYAQEPDKTIVKVVYHFIHIQDTTQRDKPYTENMMLLAGKNASLYTSFDGVSNMINSQVKRGELKKQGFTDQEINAQNAGSTHKPTSSTEFYFFAKEQKFYYKSDMCWNGCMVQAETDKINWKIAKDTMSFSGIHCQVATATYKGRNWIAWFAPELPFESGPWKLQGLPGLIITAYDDKKEVQFKLGGIEKVKDGDMATDNARNLPDDFIKNFGNIIPGLKIDRVGLPVQRPVRSGGSIQVTEKEFEKLKIEYDKDPVGFEDAQLIANGMSAIIAMRNASGGRSGGGSGRVDANGNGTVTQTIAPKTPPAASPPKVVVNNPIELPEKK